MCCGDDGHGSKCGWPPSLSTVAEQNAVKVHVVYVLDGFCFFFCIKKNVKVHSVPILDGFGVSSRCNLCLKTGESAFFRMVSLTFFGCSFSSKT